MNVIIGYYASAWHGVTEALFDLNENGRTARALIREPNGTLRHFGAKIPMQVGVMMFLTYTEAIDAANRERARLRKTYQRILDRLEKDFLP